MKNIIIAILFLSFCSLTSCEDNFAELEKDPNRPVNVPAALVLKQVQYDMYNNTGRAFSAEMRWNQFYCSNYNYYATNEYTWTEMPNHFYTLKNVTKMEEEALRAGADVLNPYSAVAKLYKAFFYEQMTKRVGDLPLSSALKGADDFEPNYDSQKSIYLQILKWLDEANADMATLISNGDNTLSGDIYFGGDLRQWQKVTNAFHLRVLTTLSAKEGDTDLNVKARFSQIVSNATKYPLLNGLEDNLQFSSNQFNKYPSNPDNFGFDATRQNMSAAYIERLKERNDPRLFKTTEPAGSEIKAGKKPNDFTAYLGAKSGEDLADMSFKAGTSNGSFAPGSYSFQNRNRYYTNYVGEATFLVGYTEMCFNIAEGLHRGWASTGTAATWYQKGIESSFEFYGIKSGANNFTYSETGGKASSDLIGYSYNFELQEYLDQPNVKYAANANGLEQIITQKYIAFFMNSGMEAYFNWRRTGYPTFYTGVGTGNSGRIALRWQYPYSERTTNSKNYKSAIDSQFSGKDDINELIWLLK